MNEPETDEPKSQSGFPLCFGHKTDYDSGAEPCPEDCKVIKQCTVATLLKHKYGDVPWYTHLS